MDLFNIYKTKVCSFGIKIIYDDIRYHNLRSIPVLNYLGYKRFTYPKSWQGYDIDLIPYEYIKDRELDAEFLPKNLVCITNQYYEREESQFSINKTIKKYLADRESNLVLVIDKKDLDIKGKLRPLDEEYFINCIFTLEDIYQSIEERYLLQDLHFKFHNTRNLFFQEMSILIKEISNDEVINFKDFFELIFDYPYLPLWNFFIEIFGFKGFNIPATKNERKPLKNFFMRRIEQKDLKLERMLKRFIDNLNLKYIHLLNPHLLKKTVHSNFKDKIDEFIKKILTIDDESIRNRLLIYLKDYYIN